MVALGLLAAAYLLQADFDRRREQFVKSGYQKRDGKPSITTKGFSLLASPDSPAWLGHVCITFWKALEI